MRLTTETRPLDRLGQLGEFEQDSSVSPEAPCVAARTPHLEFSSTVCCNKDGSVSPARLVRGLIGVHDERPHSDCISSARAPCVLRCSGGSEEACATGKACAPPVGQCLCGLEFSVCFGHNGGCCALAPPCCTRQCAGCCFDGCCFAGCCTRLSCSARLCAGGCVAAFCNRYNRGTALTLAKRASSAYNREVALKS